MRLIDADVLKKTIKNMPNDYYGDLCVGDALKEIDNAPTIAAVPVVRGEWVVTDAYPHRVYCSLCYKTNVPNEEWLYEKNDYPKYCMWCGAKMEVKPVESLQAQLAAAQRGVQDARNELCLKCGKYHEAHNGACVGCRWKEN